MLRNTTLASLATMLLLATASPASAQEALIPMGFGDYGAEDDEGMIPMGLTASIGGGVTNFVGDEPRDFTDVGGGWDVRLAFLSRFVVSAELAYIGTAQDIQAIGLDDDAALISNGVEANARLNILPGLLQPYIFGGIGYRHYNIVNDDFNTSAIADSDNVGIVPVGGGLALRFESFVLDARGTFRWAFEDEMLVPPGDDEDGGMSTWSAELRAGITI